MVTYLCGDSPIMTGQISTGRGMVRPGERGGFLKECNQTDSNDLLVKHIQPLKTS